jgi:hypothetical protein
VAEELVLSPKTVANHVDSLMRKLGVSSRTALAVRAVEAGIVSGTRQSKLGTPVPKLGDLPDSQPVRFWPTLAGD